jgi:hypothetical protein
MEKSEDKFRVMVDASAAAISVADLARELSLIGVSTPSREGSTPSSPIGFGHP